MHGLALYQDRGQLPVAVANRSATCVIDTRQSKLLCVGQPLENALAYVRLLVEVHQHQEVSSGSSVPAEVVASSRQGLLVREARTLLGEVQIDGIAARGRCGQAPEDGIRSRVSHYIASCAAPMSVLL